MNERLRELMLEAGYAAPEIAPRANKLAELIVRECLQMADEFELDVNKSGLVDRMKQNFGVE